LLAQNQPTVGKRIGVADVCARESILPILGDFELL
jgi:hypothetical protein